MTHYASHHASNNTQQLMSKPENTPKLSRRPAWSNLNMMTPTISKSKAPTTQLDTDGDIDDDPFSHFLSPVLDDEDPLDDDEYSAGISSYEDDEFDEVETKRSTFRALIGERWDNFMSRPKRPRTPPDEDQLPDLENDDADATRSPRGSPTDLKMLEEELDGWEADRARQRRSTFGSFGFPLQRPRFKSSRTLSGRKHSYTEPSADLWTVEEDDETETIRPTQRGRGRLMSR